MSKPGPKKGWATALRQELGTAKLEIALMKEVALVTEATSAGWRRNFEHMKQLHHDQVSRNVSRCQRIDNFNAMGFWAKVLFLLKGGMV